MNERAQAEQIVASLDKVESDAVALAELHEMLLAEDDASLLEDISEQAEGLAEVVRSLELARLLSGEHDNAPAIVTIHPGAGGVDAQDWAEMLLRMYLRWAERAQAKVELVDHAAGDEAGIKGASFVVHAPYAYGKLRGESGVHRLIRISPFDANARRHTAFAAVFVVPELPEDDSADEIESEDLRIDVYRASGAGGQHVNRTESAVRITHLPTNTVVQCQNERSQHKNKATAMKMLKGRLFELRRREKEAAFEASFASSKQDIAFGSQVRSYTLAPYQLVKDERTEHKHANVQAVLDGQVDSFIESYLLWRAEQSARAKNDEKV